MSGEPVCAAVEAGAHAEARVQCVHIPCERIELAYGLPTFREHDEVAVWAWFGARGLGEVMRAGHSGALGPGCEWQAKVEALHQGQVIWRSYLSREHSVQTHGFNHQGGRLSARHFSFRVVSTHASKVRVGMVLSSRTWSASEALAQRLFPCPSMASEPLASLTALRALRRALSSGG